MRVLLLKDDVATAVNIRTKLNKENIIHSVADLSDDILEDNRLNDYDIVLIDLTRPGVEEHPVMRKYLQATCADAPVLVLCRRVDLDSKVKGIGLDDDHILTEPFDRRELSARIRAIVRRSKGHPDAITRIGELEVNLDTRRVSVGDRTIHLTRKEYGILELLTLRKGTTITKEMFLTHLYGGMGEPELKIIDVFICKLRRKLAQATGGNHYIETVWGRGYVLCDPQASRSQLRSSAASPTAGA